MANTFSNIAFRMTIATGLAFGVVGVYASSQMVSSFTQSSSFKSAPSARSGVGNVFMQPSARTTAPAAAEFIPQPNPEPMGTRGTGTR